MNRPTLRNRLRMALREDGAFRDVTTARIPNVHRRIVSAKLVTRAPGVFCGSFLIKPTFEQLDRQIKVQLAVKDGSRVRPNQVLARMTAHAYAILAGERTFLNLACHLSGIATLTAKYVAAVKGTRAAIVDTRKTTPLWRDLEKWAVRCGGGENHRMDLEEAMLVKDNHLGFLRQMKLRPEAIYHSGSIRKGHPNLKFIEMEANTVAEVWEAIKAEADIVLLDNMSMDLLKEAIALVQAARRALGRNKPQIEISGGITLQRAPELAKLGVERLSVGALTHSAPALDLSLEVD